MEESQIKQIIEQQPLYGSALLDRLCQLFSGRRSCQSCTHAGLRIVHRPGQWREMGCKDDSDLYHCRLSQCSAPLCAGASFKCDYERVRRDGSETDPHCNDGTLDIADHLHG
mgnify:CR=1 FL=1